MPSYGQEANRLVNSLTLFSLPSVAVLDRLDDRLPHSLSVSTRSYVGFGRSGGLSVLNEDLHVQPQQDQLLE